MASLSVHYCKTISFVILCVLTIPHYHIRKGKTIPGGFVSGEMLSKDDRSQCTRQSPKVWRLNTNFDNTDNWPGLAGHENCSGNIYSFPWYLDQVVVTLPSTFIGKQIILPVNGHFVFREGNTTFSSGLSSQPTTCRPREIEFGRSSRADWFHPDNWVVEKAMQRDKTSQGSLLNFGKMEETSVPHVERVPCQYDSVKFPANSSFNVKISSNVSINKFYWGNKKQTYTDVAILMNSPLGKLQFQKNPETIFSIRDNSNDNDHHTQSDDSLRERDSDQCICSNYKSEMKQKICALVSCKGPDECPAPIFPHGFCCPVCGFHFRIRHSGKLRLDPLYTKFWDGLKKRKMHEQVDAHFARYKPKEAHVVMILVNLDKVEENAGNFLHQIVDFIVSFQSTIRNEKEVIEVTLTESWERRLPPGTSDPQLGSGFGGDLITLIVILFILGTLAVLAILLFMWNKKHGRPPLSFSSVTSVLHRMPSMSIPIMSGSRRSSTLSHLQSFGFARFTNERASTATVNVVASSESDQKASLSKTNQSSSSSIHRTEQVDDAISPMTINNSEKAPETIPVQFEFANVAYDLIGGENNSLTSVKTGGETTDNGSEQSTGSPPTITVVHVEESDVSSTSAGSENPTLSERNEPTTSLPLANKDEVKQGKGRISGKKFPKPTFGTFRMTTAYKKLTPEEESLPSTETFTLSTNNETGMETKKTGESVADANLERGDTYHQDQTGRQHPDPEHHASQQLETREEARDVVQVSENTPDSTNETLVNLE